MLRRVSLLCAALALTAAPLAAQDAAKVASKHYKVLAENERVRVLKVTMAPGGKAATHEHPAHVGVNLSAGTVTMTTADGETVEVPMKADDAALYPAGKHSTANAGQTPLEVIVIELKADPGTGTFPESRPGMTSTVLLDDPRVRAVRVGIEPSFTEAAGTSHDYDQVVVTLAPSDVALTMEGKTRKSWKRGDVKLIGKGVPHETHGGKQAGDIVIVSIK